MPALQVKDCPTGLYDRLRVQAEKEHRSISQQTVAILERYLDDVEHIESSAERQNGWVDAARLNTAGMAADNGKARRARRMVVLERINAREPFERAGNAQDVVDIIHETREERMSKW